MTIITRFAPSPTGYLHIGGARTALFNYLYAKKNGGKYLLRVEDTDVKRSTEEAKQAILDSLNWLGIKHDGEVVYQMARSSRHAEVAHELVANGKAYYCYTPQEEINAQREEAQAKGESFLFRSIWRDSNQTPPDAINPVVRIKAEYEGETIVNDLVQGRVVVKNEILDDMVILRSDGTPTYMLAVVVDDHDMGVTHVIRGDDHLNNTFRQIMIYKAMGWNIPEFGHIPLIHGSDGAKLSKRHGALSAFEYKNMGILPEALLNHLLRLGWSHGNEEIITVAQALEWFDIKDVNKGASRFDMTKLLNINSHYIKEATSERLITEMREFIEIPEKFIARLSNGLDAIKIRAKTILDLVEQSKFYMTDDLVYSDDIKQKMTPEKQDLLKKILHLLEKIENWEHDNIKLIVEDFLNSNGLKMGNFGEVVRFAVTASVSSPSMFEVLSIVGKKDSIMRIQNFLNSLV